MSTPGKHRSLLYQLGEVAARVGGWRDIEDQLEALRLDARADGLDRARATAWLTVLRLHGAVERINREQARL